MGLTRNADVLTYRRPSRSGFPTLVGVVVLIVTFVLTLPALARDLSGALRDHLGVLDVVQLLGGLLKSPCRDGRGG